MELRLLLHHHLLPVTVHLPLPPPPPPAGGAPSGVPEDAVGQGRLDLMASIRAGKALKKTKKEAAEKKVVAVRFLYRNLLIV